MSNWKGKNFSFHNLWRTSWILAENKKIENISETVRDRAISIELLTPRVVQGCQIGKGKIQFSQLLAAILDLAENKKVQTSGKS